MAGKIDRDRATPRRRFRLQQAPVGMVAAEAVQEQYSIVRIGWSRLEIGKAAGRRGDLMDRRPRLHRVAAALGRRAALEQGVYLVCPDRAVGDHRDDITHVDDAAGLAGDAGQGAGEGGLELIGDLGGLDVAERFALDDAVALALAPLGDRSFLHRQAPFWHGDETNGGVGHGLLLGNGCQRVAVKPPSTVSTCPVM